MRDYGTTNAAPYASAPAVGLAGDTYWNTATKILYVSDGTAWVATSAGTVGARMRQTVVQSIPNATYTTLLWDTADVNRNAAWVVGTPGRITLNVIGTYVIGVVVYFPPNATGVRSAVLTNKAGTTLAGFDCPGNATANGVCTVSTLYPVTDPTDFVYTIVYQSSGAAMNTVPAGGVSMWAWRLSS